MTASTSSELRASRRVPGVLFEPRPREPEPPAVRTDVAGFVGFEPRLRVGPASLQLVGGPPPVGHRFAVEVAEFQLVVGGVRVTVPATPALVLSEDSASISIADGQGLAYAVAVAATGGGPRLVVTAGAAASGPERAPGDAQVAARVVAEVGAGRPWVRLADVAVRRMGDAVWPDVRPALPPARCDDWNDYLLQLGTPPDDGSLLGPAVRAFFANGGGRCHVATVRRPLFEDAEGLDASRRDMIGVPGSGEAEATGLERLLLIDEVSLIDAPDLHARRVEARPLTVELPGRAREACFLPCDDLLGPVGPVPYVGPGQAGDPLYPADDDPALDLVFQTQRAMLARCLPERWRAMLLLSVPLMPDGGRFIPPSDGFAALWRDRFDRLVKAEGFAEDQAMSAAALYWPWVLTQERAGAATVAMPPGPFVAGVYARRDLARGPYVAPANETLRGVVGLTWPLDDETHGRLYSPEPDAQGRPAPAVNVVRAFPGLGVQVWGARTLATDPWLRFVPVRRGLSAIERRMKVALEVLAFEPNTPLLWLQVTQLGLGVLLPAFESGALRGERPEQAFYVRCDSALNPPEDVQAGRLTCEFGAAVAAPAEFLVFRIGRREGVVEVIEAP